MDWSRVLNTVLQHLGLFIWLGIGLGGILTLGSKDFLQQFGLAEFADQWRPWISLTFFVCVLLEVRAVWIAISRFIQKRKKEMKIAEDFVHLTPAERGLLMRLYRDSALRLPVMNPVVVSLADKMMIEQISPYVENSLNLPYYPELGPDQSRHDLATTFRLAPFVRYLISRSDDT